MAEIFDFNPVDASNTGRWPENMSPPQINDAGRADEGILARWYQDMDGSRTSSGSSNAFAVTSSRTISAMFDNLAMVFTANHSITGAATLNLNGLGAKSIRKLNSMNVQTGDIVSGQPVYVIYKQLIDQWLMMSTPAAVATPVIQVTEQGSAPSTPADGEGVFYAKTDGKAYFKSDAGTESVLTPNNSDAVTTKNAPKAFASFGVSGTTITPAFVAADFFNVASITRTGEGTFTVVFTTALPTANYLVLGMGKVEGGLYMMYARASSKTTAGFTLNVIQGDVSAAQAVDPESFDFFVLGC